MRLAKDRIEWDCEKEERRNEIESCDVISCILLFSAFF